MPSSRSSSIRPTMRACWRSWSAQRARPRSTLRARLAAKAFAHTARYDTIVARYLRRARRTPPSTFPGDRCRWCSSKRAGAALRRESASARRVLSRPGAARREHRERARAAGQGTVVQQHRRCRRRDRMRAPVRSSPPASSSSTPIPAASRSPPSARAAYERAYRTDPTSAFGGIIAFNRELDAATAQAHRRAPVRRSDRRARIRRRRARVLAPSPNVRRARARRIWRAADAARCVEYTQRHRRAAGADARYATRSARRI